MHLLGSEPKWELKLALFAASLREDGAFGQVLVAKA